MLLKMLRYDAETVNLGCLCMVYHIWLIDYGHLQHPINVYFSVPIFPVNIPDRCNEA